MTDSDIIEMTHVWLNNRNNTSLPVLLGFVYC